MSKKKVNRDQIKSFPMQVNIKKVTNLLILKTSIYDCLKVT